MGFFRVGDWIIYTHWYDSKGNVYYMSISEFGMASLEETA